MDVYGCQCHHSSSSRFITRNRLFPNHCLSVYAKSFAHCVYLIIIVYCFFTAVRRGTFMISFGSVERFSVLYKVFCTFQTNSIGVTAGCAMLILVPVTKDLNVLFCIILKLYIIFLTLP